MYGWLVLTPPLLILLAAFLTHDIIISILLGVGAASLIASTGAPLAAMNVMFKYVDSQLNIENIELFAFLLMLGAIIVLINYTGGARALGEAVSHRLKSAKAVQSASLLLSPLLFVDDALNSLTVGCIMQPLTDRFSIARVKLAYLLNAMSSPLAIAIPMSSWVAVIVKNIELSGVSTNPANAPLVTAEPFYAYLASIPFIFYTFIAIASAWFIVHANISYGPMHTHEECAKKTGNLFNGKAPRFTSATCPHAGKGSIADLIVPILTLVISTLLFVLYSGNYWLLGGANGITQAFRSAKMIPVIFASTGMSLLISYAFAYVRGMVPTKRVPQLVWDGAKLMSTSVAIIFLASVFSAILDHELHTGAYLAQLVMPAISITFMPLVTFVVAAVVALAIGSSWGTMAVLIPLIVPLIIAMTGAPTPGPLSSFPLLTACIGAILSGCVVGVHLSPVSDAVTTASTGSGSYQIDHVTTQAWYVLPSAAGSAAAFLAVGLLPSGSAFISILIGIACAWTLFYTLDALGRKRR